MTFFDPDPPIHTCPLPEYAEKQGWLCECGKAYVKEYLPDRDVNPGEKPWQWRRAMKFDIGGSQLD